MPSYIFRTDTVTLLVSRGLTRLSLSSSSLREMLIHLLPPNQAQPQPHLPSNLGLLGVAFEEADQRLAHSLPTLLYPAGTSWLAQHYYYSLGGPGNECVQRVQLSNCAICVAMCGGRGRESKQ